MEDYRVLYVSLKIVFFFFFCKPLHVIFLSTCEGIYLHHTYFLPRGGGGRGESRKEESIHNIKVERKKMKVFRSHIDMKFCNESNSISFHRFMMN